MVAKRLTAGYRDCGGAVKHEATRLGCGIASVPMATHQAIDEATRQAAREGTQSIVIDGRYLAVRPRRRSARFGCSGLSHQYGYVQIGRGSEEFETILKDGFGNPTTKMLPLSVVCTGEAVGGDR